MTVFDLTKEQIISLKEQYMIQLADCGEYGEVIHGDSSITEPSYGELIEADAIISDEVIYEHYSGITFTEDDFLI